MTETERVEMYTTRFCPYCMRARDLLERKGINFTEIPVDRDFEKRREMETRSQRRTVPQIFIDGRHIGGFDDLHALDRNGGLDPLLRPGGNSEPSQVIES